MDRYIGQLNTDAYGVTADEARVARLRYNENQAAANDDDGVHAAVNGSSTAAKTVETDINEMPCCRNITVTAGGTAADIAAGDVTVYGYDIAGNEISEAFTFSENTGGTVTGDKAFAKVTKFTIAKQDGSGATFKVGFGSKLGLPFKLDGATVCDAIFNGVVESTKPTLATDKDEIAKNTAALNSSLAGKAVEILLVL